MNPDRAAAPTTTPTPEPERGGVLPGTVAMFQKLDVRTKPNLKRAIPAGLIAVICFAFGINLGGVDNDGSSRFDLFGWQFTIGRGWIAPVVIGVALAFAVFGVIAGRSIGKELFRVSSTRAGVTAGSAIRLITVVICYAVVLFGVLQLLQVDVSSLLVGGAVTGVVIGIAAQQTLGNFFAGLVLFFSRPYVPGQRIIVRTGALGGPFEGVIVDAGMMYTILETDEGRISMPNSGLLGSAIQILPERDETDPDAADRKPFDADPAGTPGNGSIPVSAAGGVTSSTGGDSSAG